jgi:hypothetical protein
MHKTLRDVLQQEAKKLFDAAKTVQERCGCPSMDVNSISKNVHPASDEHMHRPRLSARQPTFVYAL